MAIHLSTTSVDEWAGSFVLAVTSLINDLLSDGAPFDATITFQDEDYGSFVRSGKVSYLKDNVLMIDGYLHDTADIVSIIVH